MDGKPSTAAMATELDDAVTNLKGTKIFVHVEEALIDVLVVSYSAGAKIFQGALLDITKKSSPYGIIPPVPWIPPESEAVTTVSPTGVTDGPEEKADKFHALRQRHTYFQFGPGCEGFPPAPLVYGTQQKHVTSRHAKDKSVRMRRLRPRKVLCSHCQTICNDSSDSMPKKGSLNRTNLNNKQNLETNNTSKTTQNTGDTGSVSAGEVKPNPRVSTRSTKSDTSKKKAADTTVRRFSAADGERVTVKEEPTHSEDGNHPPETGSCQDDSKNNVSCESSVAESRGRMVLRKRKLSGPDRKRSASATAKLSRTDSLKNEDTDSSANGGINHSASVKSILAKTSPVIKISFANPQGKDTVLKIPPRIQSTATTSDTEEDSSWSLQENSDYSAKKFASAKAAKKALKKAKKEAQRKAAAALCQNLENGDSASALQKNRHHHHKHKLKRKRKHKNDEDSEPDKYDLENTDTRNMLKSSETEGWCLRASFPGDLEMVPTELTKQASVYEDVKSKCLHQKLSISLKRLNAKAYMRCSPKYSIEEDSVTSDVSDVSSISVGSGSGSDYGEVPDFPKHSSPLRDMDKVKPLMMRISTRNVKKCMLESGREMTVGDIVWGKIHGFPWWPGKVLALTVSQRDNGATMNQQAHVSWFGSSTSSYMPCNQLTPFLDDFKIRYNKKKRGPYKEAIRQATLEAQQIPHKDFHEVGLVA